MVYIVEHVCNNNTPDNMAHSRCTQPVEPYETPRIAGYGTYGVYIIGGRSRCGGGQEDWGG